MKQKQSLIFSILLFICVTAVQSQEGFPFRSNEIKVQAGLSKISFQDDRLSARTKKSWAPTFRLGYTKIRNTSKQEIALGYSLKTNVDRDLLVDMTYHMPSIFYSYEKKVGDTYVGGFFENSLFLVMPRSKTGIFNNNPVSYSLFNSIGPKVSFGNRIGANEKIQLTGSAQVALLNYNVRPAFGHPYPEDFLESGTFSPTRRGMAGPLLTSGRFQTINKHQSMKIKIGAYYYVSESIKVGVDVQYGYTHNSTLDNSTIEVAEMLFGLSYTY